MRLLENMNKDKKGSQTTLSFSHQAMGTTFEIFLSDAGQNYARQASQAVFEQIDRLERLLSRFDPGSDVGQINRLKPGQSCAVGVEVVECLEKAFRIQKETRGAFTVHYDSLLTPPKKKDPPDFPLILSQSSKRFQVTLKDTWEFPKPESLLLDLGGIGKGFALEKAKDILSDWEIPKALIHGGTSTALALEASKGEKGWPVGVTGDWECPSIPRKIVVKNRAVSGSGKEVKGEHIIDPRTGLPASGHKAAWVSHFSASYADALSTAFVVMKTSEVEEFCRQNKSVWAVVVLNNSHCKIFNQNSI